MSAVGPAMADVLGRGGSYWDPLWRIGVRLSVLEQDLLRCSPVRRLAFVAHAGASAVASNQTGSRLEHSLGVFALVAHFAPGDDLARAAALLHDVGHMPFSHTLEGLHGLDHHALGTARIHELSDVLGRHGLAAATVVAVLDGRHRSILSPAAGVLKLDHLDGLVRSARAHGRTRHAPPTLLARLRLTDGGVDTDATTAADLVELVAAEARLHTATLNVIANAVVRDAVARLLVDASAGRVEQVAGMTDDELWVELLSSPSTGEVTRALRRDPGAWRVAEAGSTAPGALPYEVRRLYLDLPLVDGRSVSGPHPALAGLLAVPWSCSVVPPRAVQPCGAAGPRA